MTNRKGGRKPGTKNKGYFFRTGRGWYVSRGKSMDPLLDETGHHLKDAKTKEAVLRKAYANHLLSLQVPYTGGAEDSTIFSVVSAYLSHLKANSATGTHAMRSAALFDFCYGFSRKYQQMGVEPFRTGEAVIYERKEVEASRVHAGYGSRPVSSLTKADIDEWLEAHPTWKTSSGRRLRIQAVVIALNFGVDRGMIAANPLKGYKLPKIRSRTTYLTPEQEQAFIESSSRSFSTAVRVLIRTGMRPGIEFCHVARKHVQDYDDRMSIVFKPHETKTKKLRTILITDEWVIKTIRRLMQQYPEGPIFRTGRGTVWTRESLSSRFRKRRLALTKKGHTFDKDLCLYSLRHTFAHRCLTGYWTGKPQTVETVSRIMGITPDVARKHYLQWSRADIDHLWASV